MNRSVHYLFTICSLFAPAPLTKMHSCHSCVTACFALLLALSDLVGTAQTWAEEPTLDEMDRLVKMGQLEQAVTAARELQPLLSADIAGIRSTVRLARALQAEGKMEESAEFYALAIAAAEEQAAQTEPDPSPILRLAATGVLLQSARYRSALEMIGPLFSERSSAQPEQRRQGVIACLQLGVAALTAAEFAVATEAYRIALDHGDGEHRLTAGLGFGWSVLVQGERSHTAVNALAAADQNGSTTTDLLRQMPAADAVWLAAVLLGQNDQSDWSDQARIAAARWAAETGRWSLLAAAADTYQPLEEPTWPAAALARWFAEALVQTDRRQEARQWWNHLVDDRGATDFAALLRCAEAETDWGESLATAERRIAAARAAVADDPLRAALVDLLAAQVEIRRSAFERARVRLQGISESDGLLASIRGRALWLIGETYYLQRDFPAAIEAYRQVETTDPEGFWAAAALVQAGKSFEQLGRTRQAAVCYGNLVQHHPATAHAQFARRRLAAIAPSGDATDPSVSSSTIRR